MQMIEKKFWSNTQVATVMQQTVLFFLFISYTLFPFYLLHFWNKPISKKLIIIPTLMLLSFTAVFKKMLFGSCAGSWKQFGLSLNKFLLNYTADWNYSVRSHFSTLDKSLCVSIGAAVLVSVGAYFLIPDNPFTMQKFMPEHISMYSMVDSSSQRIAYEFFLFIVMGLTFYYTLLKKNVNSSNIASNQWSVMLGVLVLFAAALSLWTTNLDSRAGAALAITMAIAFGAQYANLRWIAWGFIAILIICALVPGWLHSPEPAVSWLKSVDQHYDSVIYRGRQLGAGHLFSGDAPPLYSMLWAILIGIVAQEIQPPTFGELIRFVQVGQALCLAAFMLAAILRTRGQSRGTRALVMTFAAVAVVPWLSTEGSSTWLPNQSGLRFLFLPIAVCSVFLIERISVIRAGFVAGLVAGLALIANFETGVVATAGLGVAWLIRVRNEAPRLWFYSAMSCFAAAFGCYFMLELTYRNFFGASIFPDGISALFERLSNSGGFAGLKLPFRSLAIVIIVHSSYKFIESISGVFNRSINAPDAVTIAIATMLLVWFPYYVNRPDDWNLWLFIALYILLLIPTFKGGRKNILPFIVASFIVLPISVRSLPISIIDPLVAQWRSENQPVCAGGLILPRDFCGHLQIRAKTLQYLASQGSVGWSTSLPLLTDQTANIRGPFWTGNLLGFTLRTADFNELIKKIMRLKLDFILFDDPDDRFILPRPPEISFNRKLYSSLQRDYCELQLQGGWLIAQRKRNGSCDGKNESSNENRLKYL